MGLPDLPDWVQEIRPHQVTAVDAIDEAFEDHEVVFLDAPTGSGKTLIAELSRRRRYIHGETSALYVCSDKGLQDQFARDFPYAKVLKGRANYPTVNDPEMTAADCTSVGDGQCWFCPMKQSCPYEIAKDEAMRSPLAVTNTAYMLTEANFVGGFSGRDLIIADEGDTLESMMMNFVEFTTPRRYLDAMQLDPPKKGARKTTIVTWLGDYITGLVPLIAREQDPKRYRALVAARKAAERIIPELEKDIQKRQADDESSGTWLRDYSDRENILILKPVTVLGHGARYLWRHGGKFLVMSATIISADEMAESLGLPFDYTTVSVPMTFPVENRPIIMAPVANVVYKEMREALPRLAYAVQQIANRHDGERILVHTVSYKLTKDLYDLLKWGEFMVEGRKIFTYTTGRDRESALEGYKRTPGAVLIAPSVERGVDLPGDLCRVQVIAKCPFPALQDRQVSARTHLPGGQMWYTVKTIRDIVQMAGRAVRNEDDWATTYILDAQFGRNLWGKWKTLFPGWFREAVKTNADVRWLLR